MWEHDLFLRGWNKTGYFKVGELENRLSKQFNVKIFKMLDMEGGRLHKVVHDMESYKFEFEVFEFLL